MTAPITPELLRQRQAEDEAWFAARMAELAEWRAEAADRVRDRQLDEQMRQEGWA